MDFSFDGSRESKLLKAACEAVEELDSDAFSQCLGEYDNIKKFTPWETSVLLKVKKAIEEQANEIPDLG